MQKLANVVANAATQVQTPHRTASEEVQRSSSLAMDLHDNTTNIHSIKHHHTKIIIELILMRMLLFSPGSLGMSVPGKCCSIDFSVRFFPVLFPLVTRPFLPPDWLGLNPKP